jgi:AraC-like DNA-binding protein
MKIQLFCIKYNNIVIGVMKMRRHAMLPTLQDSQFFIFPESVGWYSEMPEHYVDREEGKWVSYSLHYIVAGKGYVELDGQLHTLQKGDAFLYYPNQKQLYYSSQEEPWDVRWVHFYGNKLKEFLVDRGFLRNLWTLKVGGELERAYEALLMEAEEHNILRATRLSSLVYTILIEFMNYAQPLTANRGTDSADRMLALLPLMQQSACEPFSLEEWAHKAGISVHYFCKLFRKTTSMTPLDFITLCRIQTAKQWLIEQPNWHIKKIAREAGYPSTSYFNQRFLKREGMTPSEYRRLYFKSM